MRLARHRILFWLGHLIIGWMSSEDRIDFVMDFERRWIERDRAWWNAEHRR